MSVRTAQHAEGPGLTWLYGRIEELGFSSLSAFARSSGINKGNLYRYFSHESKPAVSVLPVLCRTLQSDPETILAALGVNFPVEV